MIRNENTTDLGFIILRPFCTPWFPPSTAFLDYFILASFLSIVLASDYLFDNSFPKESREGSFDYNDECSPRAKPWASITTFHAQDKHMEIWVSPFCPSKGWGHWI